MKIILVYESGMTEIFDNIKQVFVSEPIPDSPFSKDECDECKLDTVKMP